MNPLNFLQTTNYPNALLENTFGNQYFKNVVEPTKAAIQSGSKVTKPALGQLIKNWNPLKAFTPQMLATGPTKAASTFLKSSGIGTLASLLFAPTHLGADDMPTEDVEQGYFDYYSKYGDNYSDLKIPGWNKKMIQNKRNQLMNRRKQDMQQRIRQHEAAQAVKQKPTPTYTGPVTHSFDPKQDTGRRPDKPGGFTDPGKGSYGPHMAYGGRASYFDGGLLSLWPR